VVLLALGITSSAAGYCSRLVDGSASAILGTAQAISVSHATASGQLYPGAAVDVTLSLSNPNPLSVTVSSLSLNRSRGNGGFAVDRSHSACNVSALAFTSQTNGGAGWSVPPRIGSRNGTLAVDLHDALTMDTEATNACREATFTFYLTDG
jgi:hypothetical protein